MECHLSSICGLYYKHVTIVNDNSSVISKRSFKLIDDPKVVNYNHQRFIIQATGDFLLMIIQAKPFYSCEPFFLLLSNGLA